LAAILGAALAAVLRAIRLDIFWERGMRLTVLTAP
jgi:hypothetical protein